VVELDTPGGLESSMRDMVSREFTAPVPVIVWVTPSGGHAASAGVFITMAADVAAMSPGTNIGAATPISLQGPMDSTLAKKAANDAAAFARTVAEHRRRSITWAEKAVREAVAASEREAVEQGIVDFVAATPAELLEKADGRWMRRAADSTLIHVAGAVVVRMQPSLRHRLLAPLVDPNVAYLLLMLGFYGILFELQNPGAILPGVAGAIFLLLAFFALSALPVNAAGLALLILGVGFLVAEIKVHSHGLLTVGGAIAMAIGGLMLFDDRAVHVAWPLVLATTAVTVAFFAALITLAIRGRRGPRASGVAAILGRRAQVIERLGPRGRVRLDAEVWNAEAAAAIEVGAEVVVTGVEGLTLRVRPAAREA
jgi:membrane-bound serine protease (ClpP class)